MYQYPSFFHQLLYPVANLPQRTISKVWLVLEYLALLAMTLIALQLAKESKQKTAVIFTSLFFRHYYGSYKDFIKVQAFLNTVENLFPVGRNGMHRYKNSDHSMLTAMAAVENIINHRKDKTNIRETNTEDECHEESAVS